MTTTGNLDAELECQLAERTLLRCFLLLALTVLGVGAVALMLVTLGGKHTDAVTVWAILIGVQLAALVAAADIALVLRSSVRVKMMPALGPLRRRIFAYLIVAAVCGVAVPIVVAIMGADLITALAAALIGLELVAALAITQRRVLHRERRLASVSQ